MIFSFVWFFNNAAIPTLGAGFYIFFNKTIICFLIVPHAKPTPISNIFSVYKVVVC